MKVRDGQAPCPEPGEVIIYFNQQGQPEEVARRFYDHYQSSGWRTARGTLLSDWKRFARYWIKRERKK